MLDASTFRSALGRLATGVSIVTTTGPDARDYGMTVTALCSLSLEPLLILACVDKDATMYPQLSVASHFAVSILESGQESLSRRFAETAGDRFSGVDVTRGVTGCALIAGALAHVECAVWAQYEGGDHTIFAGRVVHAEVRDAEPLLHFRGRYARLAR